MNVEFWANFSKRRISLARPGAAGTTKTCVLKDDTSITTPTISLAGHAYFSYNYAYISDFGRYYYVNEIKTIGPNTEISLVCDVLATYKDSILASTQYITYSANASKTWLADTRIPLSKNATVTRDGASTSGIFYTTGFFVLTVNGKNGCAAYIMSSGALAQLIQSVDQWKNDSISGVLTGQTGGVTYDWTTTEKCLESLGKMMTQTDIVGNAYANAPSCIRSCIWVPFDATAFDVGSAQNVFLGEFDTGVSAFRCRTGPVVFSKSVNIPWQHSDWRRGVCEDLYMYLPFAGCVHLSADSLIHASTIDIQISISATDGTVCYRLSDGNYTIGTYGGSCAANYPIGINQQASAGQILQTGVAGIEKQLSAGVQSSISPLSAASAAAASLFEGVVTAYNVMDVAFSTNPSTIGSFGGGAGAGLGNTLITIASVSHDTIISPSDMAATMGRPAMEPMSLANLTGFCQCANAHLAMNGTADEKNAVDTFLNSGIYIE